MFCLPFLKQPDLEDSPWAVIDIAPHCISALVFKKLGENIEVLGVGSAEQKQSDMRGGVVADLANVAQNACSALDQAVYSQGIDYPPRAVIGAGAEIIRHVTVRARINRKESEQPITESEWQKIEDRLTAAAAQKCLQDVEKETGQKNVKLQSLDTRFSHVLLDGFEITNPIGFRGNVLEAALFYQAGIKSHLSAVDSVASFLKFKQTFITDTNTPVLLKDYRDQILLNDRGLTTEVTVQANHAIMGTKVVPLGSRHLEKENGDMLDWWASSLELALEDFDASRYPFRVVLLSNASIASDLKKQIPEFDWQQGLDIAQDIVVEDAKTLDPDDMVDRSGKLSQASASLFGLMDFVLTKKSNG